MLLWDVRFSRNCFPSILVSLLKSAAVSCCRRCNISTCQEQEASLCWKLATPRHQFNRWENEVFVEARNSSTPLQKFSLPKSVVYFKDQGMALIPRHTPMQPIYPLLFLHAFRKLNHIDLKRDLSNFFLPLLYLFIPVYIDQGTNYKWFPEDHWSLKLTPHRCKRRPMLFQLCVWIF